MKKLASKILIILLIVFVSQLIPIGVMVSSAEPGTKEKSSDLEKIVFIHWKKNFTKPEKAKAKAPTCYSFLTPTKIKWVNLPVNYRINPNNPQGLSEEFINGSISVSAETWDNATTKELMNNTYTVDYSAQYGIQDYKNSIDFGNYPTSGVIAVTTVWYNTRTKTIVEFDIRFDTDFQWGNAEIDLTKMDLQNIAAHEFGHSVGLSDVYNSTCSTVTMYGYSREGEIQKRTLEQADITGLQKLYGI